MNRHRFFLIVALIFYVLRSPIAATPALSTANRVDPHQTCDSIAHPLWKGRFIYRFGSPDERLGKTVFLFHGVNAADPIAYGGLINHIVDKGWNVIFVPYSTIIAMTSPWETYAVLWQSVQYAYKHWHTDIDTTRIGIVGHSYGGGVAPWIASKLFSEKGWGGRSAFIYTMAPWFTWNLDNRQLTSFNPSVLFLAQVFADDNINDFRMALDLYSNFGKSSLTKRFVMVRSDPASSRHITITHDTPNGAGDKRAGTDMLDSLAIYPLFDRISACALNHTDFAADSLLGVAPAQHTIQSPHDSTMTIILDMPAAPVITTAQGRFVNFWYHVMNPRAARNNHTGERFGAVPTFSNFFYVAMRRLLPETDTMSASEGDITIKRLWDPATGDRRIITIVKETLEKKPVHFCIPALISTSFIDYRPFCIAMARRGYLCVFVNHSLLASGTIEQRAEQVIASLETACEELSPLIDTTRIIIIGHAVGGAMAPVIAAHFFTTREWGTAGATLWCIAMGKPGYLPYNLPTYSRLFVWNFSDSWKHDWRFGARFFNESSLPPLQKQWIVTGTFNQSDQTAKNPRTAPQGILESTFFSTPELFSFIALKAELAFEPCRDTIVSIRMNNTDIRTSCTAVVTDIPSPTGNFFFAADKGSAVTKR